MPFPGYRNEPSIINVVRLGIVLDMLAGGERGQNREVLPPLTARYIYCCTSITCYNESWGLYGDRDGDRWRTCGVWGEPHMAQEG